MFRDRDCTTRRRSWARSTRTNSSRHVTVGTTKKSAATNCCAWLVKNVRHVCEGRGRRRTIIQRGATPHPGALKNLGHRVGSIARILKAHGVAITPRTILSTVAAYSGRVLPTTEKAMRKSSGSLAICALAAASFLSCAEREPPGPAVDTAAAMRAEYAPFFAFLDVDDDEELAQTPEAATRLGRKDNYDKLNDFSEAQQDRMLEWRRKSVVAMKAQFDRANSIRTLRPTTTSGRWSWIGPRAVKFRRDAYVFGFGNASVHSDRPNFLISFHRVDSAADMDVYTSRVGQLARGRTYPVVERAQAAARDGIQYPNSSTRLSFVRASRSSSARRSARDLTHRSGQMARARSRSSSTPAKRRRNRRRRWPTA